jgi:thiol:disulfide interchange protein
MNPTIALVRAAVAASLLTVVAFAQEPQPAPTPVTPTTPATPATPIATGTAKSAAKTTTPTYDEKADARQQVAAALAKAKRDNQRVLIQWGANWCGWCNWLAATMKSDGNLSRKLLYEYRVVHVDVGQFNKHMDLAKELGAELKAIPFLTILDADGKPLVQQPTEPFEVEKDGKKGHDAAKLVTFLTEHQAKPQVAAEVLAAAMATAKAEQKRVFLHFGAPWCGWCHRLEDWAARPEVAARLGRHFVDVKVDNERMTGGEEIYKNWLGKAGQKQSGIPWFVFLDADGAVLAHATGPKGNVGFPYQPEEIEHFGTMLRDAKTAMTETDIAWLLQSLDDNRKADEAARAKKEAAKASEPKAPDRQQ